MRIVIRANFRYPDVIKIAIAENVYLMFIQINMEEIKDFNKMSVSSIVETCLQDRELYMTIADNMKEYGGSFVQALAECFYRADSKNQEKLLNAFIGYVLDYQPKNWPKGK